MLRVAAALSSIWLVVGCATSGFETVDAMCTARTSTVGEFARCLKANEHQMVKGRGREMAPMLLAASEYMSAEISARRLSEQEGRFRLASFRHQLKQEHAAREDAALARSMAAFGAMTNAGNAMIRAGQPQPVNSTTRLQTTCVQSGVFLNCN